MKPLVRLGPRFKLQTALSSRNYVYVQMSCNTNTYNGNHIASYINPIENVEPTCKVAKMLVTQVSMESLMIHIFLSFFSPKCDPQNITGHLR